MRRLGLVMALALAAGSGVVACTLWGATGDAVRGGGSLLAKNRDWTPAGRQQLSLVKPRSGHGYLALQQIGGDAPGTRAGLNDQGLAVVSASVSTIPKAERRAQKQTSGLIAKLLTGCTTVDQALARRDWLVGTQYLMLADAHEIAWVELGPDRQLGVQRSRQGWLAHTNHYLHPDLAGCNETAPAAGTTTRLARITELLRQGPQPFDLLLFREFSQDRHDGPDHSLLRTGSKPGGAQTVAQFVTWLPPAGSPQVWGKLLTGQRPAEYEFAAADVFGGQPLRSKTE